MLATAMLNFKADDQGFSFLNLSCLKECPEFSPGSNEFHGEATNLVLVLIYVHRCSNFKLMAIVYQIFDSLIVVANIYNLTRIVLRTK